MVERDDAFYVGYLPQAPASLARFVRPRVVALLAFVALLALALAAAQSPFAAAVFEYGVERDFEGVVRERPYPALVVDRPGVAAGASRYLLVSAGKLGADEAVRGLDGRRARLRGSLVFRDDRAMIELVADSIAPLGADVASSAEPSELERGRYRGEIVDSKCFLGVMKPGNLKPHRDCAVRCISGGVPPVLLVRGADGRASYLLLAGSNGEAIGRELLDHVAEPIEIEGRVLDLGGQLALFADLATLRRIE